MRGFVRDISYRAFYLLLALAILWMMPVFVHLFSEFVTAVLLPLFEDVLHNVGNSGAAL
jgi:hypothetical protein